MSRINQEEEQEDTPKDAGYDFERMIQEAMEKYGEDPAVKAPPKKDVPASDSNTDAPKKKVMDPKK